MKKAQFQAGFGGDLPDGSDHTCIVRRRDHHSAVGP